MDNRADVHSYFAAPPIVLDLRPVWYATRLERLPAGGWRGCHGGKVGDSVFNALNSRAKTEERNCSTLFISPRFAWGRYAAQSRCLQAAAGQAGRGGRCKHPAFAMKSAKSYAFALQQNEVQRLRFRHPAPSCSSSPAVTLFAVKSAKRARASPPLPQERAQECTDASEERQSAPPARTKTRKASRLGQNVLR